MFRYFRIAFVTNQGPFLVVDTAAGREFRVGGAVGAAFDLGFGVVEIAVEGLDGFCYAVFLLRGGGGLVFMYIYGWDGWVMVGWVEVGEGVMEGRRLCVPCESVHLEPSPW